MKRFTPGLALSAAALIFALVAAPAARADMVPNGLSFNGLSFNGLSFNGLSFNGLSFNGGRREGARIDDRSPAVRNELDGIKLENAQVIVQPSR